MASFTREQLTQMGLDEAQIAAILSVNGEEKAPVQKEDKVVPFTPVEQEVERKELKVTSLSDIRSYANGCLVELPPFGEGQPFVARLRRPSLLVMVKSGKIPNELINQATALFAKGANSMVGQNNNTLNDMCEIIDVVIESALVEPTVKDIEAAGMELSDDQKMAIFSYTQSGISALKSFRTK